MLSCGGMVKQSRNFWYKRLRDVISSLTRWLVPGLGVKRWLGLVLFGTTLLGVGLAILILDVYRTTPETWWLPLISAASLRFLPRLLRALIFGFIGMFAILGGIWGLNRSLMAPFIQPGRRVVDTLTAHRRRGRGPRVVGIGGGHGLATLLRGIKVFTHNITAIVTVADDGGSSGRLRQSMGILPPGDIRNCLAALSNDEAMLSQLPVPFSKWLKGFGWSFIWKPIYHSIGGNIGKFRRSGGRIRPGAVC